MTGIDIIRKTAFVLNVKEIIEDSSLINLTLYNFGDAMDRNYTFWRMVELLRVFIQDLTTQIQPIEKQLEIESVDKEIDLSNFENLIKITKIQKDGVNVKFSLKNGKIVLPADSTYTVSYRCYFTMYDPTADIDMSSLGIGGDVFVYGYTAMYCLAVGLFDEFNIYNAIYNEKIEASKKMKIIEMPNRRWE